MVSISNYDITISKANDAIIDIELFNNGEPYTPAQDESIVFCVKKWIYDTEYIIEKTVENGVLTLTTEDTNIRVGKYVYDITLIGPNSRDTVIGPNNLYIKEVVNNAQSNS